LPLRANAYTATLAAARRRRRTRVFPSLDMMSLS
jgi:hypothetical protein